MESHLKKIKVQSFSSDMISTIPQSIVENILIRLPIKMQLERVFCRIRTMI